MTRTIILKPSYWSYEDNPEENELDIHIGGQTADGKTVHLIVCNFKPYIYIEGSGGYGNGQPSPSVVSRAEGAPWPGQRTPVLSGRLDASSGAPAQRHELPLRVTYGPSAPLPRESAPGGTADEIRAKADFGA